MALVNTGRDILAALMTGASTLTFNAANAKIGVGDSTIAFAIEQTDLKATTNKFRKGMDDTFPITENNTVVLRATFGPTEANFPWNEWGVFNAENGGSMLNRVVEYNGTKLEGQTWVFQVTLTIDIR